MQPLEEGQRFKRYRILQRLGSSVAGTSYEAEDTLLQRKVALKQIHPWGILSDAARRQFFREMQTISALTHPCLAAILDYGEVDGQLYLARRYVTPGSLLSSEGRYWFHPPLDVTDAVSYTCQLAEALSSIHSNGYVHGALTFTNVLIASDPNSERRPDFAPFLISDVGSTHFVRRFGRPQTTFLPITAAPEQFDKHVMEASDQYALAVILYFWLTGRPPFTGTPDEIEQLKRTETITTLTAVNLKVPLELEGVIRRALSVYPEDRYPSIPAFADALRASAACLSQNSLTDSIPGEDLVQSSSLSPSEFVLTIGQQQPAPDQPAQSVPPAPSEPLPQVVPDVPQPLHDPNPDPIPLPTPEEPPAPQPEPAPDPPLPVPGPDIPQPIPEPKPIPPAEPAKAEGGVFYEEISDLEDEEMKLKDEGGVFRDEEVSDPEDEETRLEASILITSPYNKIAQEVILEKEETTLGHAGSSDILLDHDTLISRHHALLQHIANRYEVHDLKSATGILVNGQRIPVEIGYTLKDGDYISIGEYKLLFRLQHASEFLEQVLSDRAS